MNEETLVLEHLNFFNKVISEFLTVDVKINEEEKVLILHSSLPQSYDHIVTIMLYSKKILILKRSRQLSYLVRSEKGQIKRRSRIGFGGHMMKRKSRRKERFGLIKVMSLLSQRRTLE